MREAISQGGQAARSTIAGVLSMIVAKVATVWDATAPIAQELSILTFLIATQVGMWARNHGHKVIQWLG